MVSIRRPNRTGHPSGSRRWSLPLLGKGLRPLATGPRKSSVPYRVQVGAGRSVTMASHSSDPLDRFGVDTCWHLQPFAGSRQRRFSQTLLEQLSIQVDGPASNQFWWFATKPQFPAHRPIRNSLLCHRCPLALFRRTTGGCLMDNRGLARKGGQGGVPTQEGSSLRPLERQASWRP